MLERKDLLKEAGSLRNALQIQEEELNQERAKVKRSEDQRKKEVTGLEQKVVQLKHDMKKEQKKNAVLEDKIRKIVMDKTPF